mgnify:CR=1 FL=1
MENLEKIFLLIILLNSAFTKRARGRPGSPRDVEKRLDIKPDKGRNFVEFDAHPNEFQVVPPQKKTVATERMFTGDVNLMNRNASFTKR